MPGEIPWKDLGDLLSEGLKRTTKALEAIAPPAPSPAAQIVSSASDERRIPLDLIDPNPYQVRAELDEQKLRELVDNIRHEGSLLQPILVRRVGDRYQSICGHRRTAAFRRLRDEAKADEERARWSTIPARELQNVTEDQMLLLALDENVIRSDLTPVEEAAALSRLRDVRTDLHTADDLANFTGYRVDKVARLLRLADAPEYIRDAVHKGIVVPIPPDPQAREPETEERRRLDFSSALALIACRRRLCDASSNKANPDQSVDEKLSAVVQNALKEDWSRARINEWIEKTSNASAAQRKPESKRRGRPKLAFKRSKKQLTVYYDRVAKITPEQQVALREALQDILKLLPQS